MTPQTFARAIVSIESKYGLRLDAEEVWLRLDEFKKVKGLQGGKCNEAKGWYGLKGNCKRGKKGEGEGKGKESKREVANKIRERKGMKPIGESSSTPPKSKPPTQAKKPTAPRVPKEKKTEGKIDPATIKKGDRIMLKKTKNSEPIEYEYHSLVGRDHRFVGATDKSKFAVLDKTDFGDLEEMGLMTRSTNKKQKSVKDPYGFTPGKTYFTAVGPHDPLKTGNSDVMPKNVGIKYEYQGLAPNGDIVSLGLDDPNSSFGNLHKSELDELVAKGKIRIHNSK